MRWELTKRAWELARGKFPDTKRLYVDMPDRLGASGRVPILDLESPSAPLGHISYDVRNVHGQPRMVMAIDGVTVATGLPKRASSSMGVSKIGINSVDPRGLPQELSESAVADWMRSRGADPSLLPPLCEHLGVAHEARGFNRLAIKSKAKFKEFQRVRIKDQNSMEYQEVGQVLGVRGTAKDGYYYLVIVDGSAKPQWFSEDVLAPNLVGFVEDGTNV